MKQKHIRNLKKKHLRTAENVNRDFPEKAAYEKGCADTLDTLSERMSELGERIKKLAMTGHPDPYTLLEIANDLTDQ